MPPNVTVCLCTSVLIAFAIVAVSLPNRSREGQPTIEAHTPPGEKMEYAVNSSLHGYVKLTNFGVSVQRGSTSELSYNVTLKACSSEMLDNASSSFVDLLTEKEIPYYQKLKNGYKGSLDVPFLRWVGINLHSVTSKETMDYAASRQPNYMDRSAFALEILRAAMDQNVVVNGTFKVTGASFIPTEAFVFTKAARITFQDGSVLNVISSWEKDTVVGSARCMVIPASHIDNCITPATEGVTDAIPVSFSCLGV